MDQEHIVHSSRGLVELESYVSVELLLSLSCISRCTNSDVSHPQLVICVD